VIDWTQRPEYLAWVNAKLGAHFTAAQDVTLTSLSPSGSILAIVVFSGFSKWNCEVTAVVVDPRGVNRKFIRACLGYVFYQADLHRLTAFIAVDHTVSLDRAQRLGFKKEGLAKAWFGDKDAFLLGLLRDDALNLWFKDLHEKPFSAAGS
jgi:L-amino acid N-acyltransferase YncA